ncbi:alpha/beta hydrolase family protein [Jonesia quinghaiensis]|uniref:alpha/beta hydrolase family protein n=1 Tax=Jonesia quinghaiensis TaxID=262806 RepID=UPI0003FB56F0|nr:alpha/beta hydrolase [Jonesia quinghaiensis]
MRKEKRKGVVATLIGIVTVTVILACITLAGNNYRFDQRSITVPGPEGDLAGVLTLPPDGTARGLVVMVHGDGPVEATQQGLYSPWFEGAADAGFATLSWSKPGIGGSGGDWLTQSMEDRATEVSAAIDWAHTQSDIPTSTIVLWGASQAGWVLPKVTRERNDIDGVVAVSPAINWLRQGRYNLLAELEHNGANTEEREAAIEESDHTRRLLERGASYEEYIASTGSATPMTEARWAFVHRNVMSDATADLIASAAKPIPVHLMLGTHDRNVDVAETEATYQSIFDSSLTITRFDAAHSLARPVMEDNDVVGIFTGTVWPRTLLAPGVIDDYTAFLARIP